MLWATLVLGIIFCAISGALDVKEGNNPSFLRNMVGGSAAISFYMFFSELFKL